MRSTLVALAASSLLAAVACRETRPAPNPDTSSMEPEVSRKIEESRARASSEPGSAVLWGELGMVFQAHDLFAEAKESYSVARSLDGRDFRWPYLQARCAVSLQEMEAALDSVRAAIEIEPGYAPLHVLEAELHESGGRLEEALASYGKALALDSRSAAAELGVGRIELERGNIDEGRAHLENAAKLEPDSGSIQAMLARAYQRAGEGERARVAAERARALPLDVSLDDPVMSAVLEESVSVAGYQRRAVEAESRGELDRAEELLRHLVVIRPGEATFHFNLANHLSRRGRPQEAVSSYRKALELQPSHTSALVNLGILLIQRGERSEAKTLLERALALEPDHPGALASFAKLLALEGDLAGALQYFEVALAADPLQVESHYGIAQVLRVQGESDLAIAAFQRALAVAPTRADIHFDLATTYASRGDYSKAWIHVQDARKNGLIPPDDFISALSERMAEPKNP
jgi:tetratricopeptide (TPR) repeat protein